MPPTVKITAFFDKKFKKKLLHSSKFCPLRLIPSGQPTLIVFRDGFKPLSPLHCAFCTYFSRKKCKKNARSEQKTHLKRIFYPIFFFMSFLFRNFAA